MSSISYSTTGFRDREVEAALDAIGAAGFPQAEIVADEPDVAKPVAGQALSEFRSRLRSGGVRARSVHAPMGRNVLGAPQEGWRRQVVPVLASWTEFAGAIDAQEVVVHPIPNARFVADGDDPAVLGRMRDALFRSLDDLVPVAQQAGIRILLENLPYCCDFPLLTMRELRSAVDAYPQEHVGLVIDVGHAWTRKDDPAAEILAAGPRLWGTHLQDVDYDEPADNHWVPTHGGLDWDAIRGALRAVNYAGAWTFEVHRSRNNESPEELACLCRQVAAIWGL